MNERKQKKKTKKKIDKYVGRRIAAISIIVVVILIIINIVCGKDKDKTNELKILYNNNEIDYSNVIVESGDRIYFSINDLTKIFDNNLYYNDAEKELITTFNKHVALLKVDETFMVVNDSNVKLSTSVKEINDVVLVPINDMEIVYDIEINYSEEENILMLDSIDKEKKEATTLKNVKLKEEKGAFKKTIEKVEENQKVFVIAKEDKYYKVRTQNGNIGFIKENKLSEVKNVRDNLVVEKIDLNILKDNSDVKVYESVKCEDNKLNIVNPDVLNLDSNSEIATNAVVNSDSFTEYISWANENNIYVMPTLKNSVSVSSSLLAYSDRNKFINELYVLLVKNGAKGVYIDFEEIDDLNSFYRFLIELTPKFKESGMYVIVENNKLLDKTKLESIVDYVVEEK